MHKLLPLAVSVMLLVSSAGSVALGGGSQGQGMQAICRAPASFISSIVDSMPAARPVPALLESGEKALEVRMPGVASLVRGR